VNEPNLVLHGGRIYPTPRAAPVSAMLIVGGRVARIGAVDVVRAAAARSAREIDLRGGTATAGFTDAHVHLTSFGLMLRRVGLSDSRSIEEALARIASASGEGEGWILGQGWSAARFGRLPTRQDLDAVTAGRPAFLDSQDIHSAWLNSRALELCGIRRETTDPPGGRIERDAATGEPTGVVSEAARVAALRVVPEPGEEEILEALRDAQRRAHALGITGVHSVEAEGLRDFRWMEERGELSLRVLQHIQLHHLEQAVHVGLRSGFGHDRFRVGGVKMFLDGSLGSRTAWLREPYVGSSDRGVRTLPEREFREAVALASRHGLSSTVHAIGDAAVELAIEVLRAHRPSPVLPHRIEHVQLCPPDLWPALGTSGIIASMQPVHLLTDIPTAERYWGHERSAGAFAFRGLLRNGGVLAFGSDVPVETIDPRPGLFAAVRRAAWDAYGGAAGEANWFGEQALTMREAIAGYTEGPAIAGGLAGRLGRLEPGYLADLTVWSDDPMETTPERLRELECTLTVVEGTVVHGGEP
jgi:predicted amidohydrolase YtcJ